MNNEVEKLLTKAFNDLDIFNAAILMVLLAKELVTLEEFEEIKKMVAPKVAEAQEKQREQMEKALGL